MLDAALAIFRPATRLKMPFTNFPDAVFCLTQQTLVRREFLVKEIAYRKLSDTLGTDGDIDAVQKLAGHQDIQTTQKYLNASDPRLKRAVNNLAAARPLHKLSGGRKTLHSDGEFLKWKWEQGDIMYRQAVEMMQDGLSCREVAEELSIGKSTVHRWNAKAKSEGLLK